MGFRVGNYCKIWSVDDQGKYSIANVSVSKKKDRDDPNSEYITEFQDGYVRLVGTAHEVMQGVNIPDGKGVSAKITSCDVTNKYDAEKKKLYTNYVIFGLELSDGSSDGGSNNGGSKKSSKKAQSEPTPIPDDEPDVDLPF